jgi:DNA polymerase III epsilon subunit-like protein
MTAVLPAARPDPVEQAPARPPAAPALVFCDTETTGLHPDLHRVWEIAMVHRRPAADPDTAPVTTEHLIYVRDVELGTADPYALRVGRFYDRHPAYTDRGRRTNVQGGEPAAALVLTEAEAARLVHQVTRGALLVANNAAFDADLLARLLRRHHLTPAWDYHLVDVAALTLGRLRRPPPYRSDQLYAELGVEPAPPELRHTAMGDALWVERVYDAVFGPGPAGPADPTARLPGSAAR